MSNALLLTVISQTCDKKSHWFWLFAGYCFFPLYVCRPAQNDGMVYLRLRIYQERKNQRITRTSSTRLESVMGDQHNLFYVSEKSQSQLHWNNDGDRYGQNANHRLLCLKWCCQQLLLLWQLIIQTEAGSLFKRANCFI